MLDKLLLGRYLQGDSFVHQLDPRTKFISTFVFIIIIFLANNWLTYLILEWGKTTLMGYFIYRCIANGLYDWWRCVL